MGNLVNGKRPRLASTKNRNKVETEELFKEVWQKEQKELDELQRIGYTWEEGTFTSSRKLKLAHRTLIPPDEVKEAKKTAIVFFHGYGDSLRWYVQCQMIKYAQQGYLVTGMEIEGHGKSEHKLGLFYDLKKVADDLYQFVALQQKKYPMENWFVHGESLGGCLALLFSIRLNNDQGTPKIDGLVLASPMCKVDDEVRPGPCTTNTLLCIKNCVPTWSCIPTKFSDDLIFKREDVRKQAAQDPLRYFGKPRLASGAAMLKAQNYLAENFHIIDTPFFLIHGTKDVVTSHTASEELYEKCQVKEEDKKLVLVEDGWHSLLLAESEEDKEKHWNEIFKWLDERVQKKQNSLLAESKDK